MLEYAFRKFDKNKELLFIDEVDNGNDCDCICPHCKDELTANNKGKIKRHYFSHQNKNENRDCLMTQLHLVAQKYFKNLAEFQVPDVVFVHNSHELKKSGKASRIISATMEEAVGRYFADVFIITQDGPFAIEICVTHPCEDEKILHYKDVKLPSIEYDLSKLRSLDIQDALKLLQNNSVDYKWLYPWSSTEMIASWEAKLAQRKKLYLENQIRKAHKSSKNLLETRKVFLPSLNETLVYYFNNIEYKVNMDLIKSEYYILDELNVEYQRDDCLILKGMKKNSSSERTLWVVYMYHNTTPNILQTLKGSIVVRRPMLGLLPTEEWYWYSHNMQTELLDSAYENVKLIVAATAQADKVINSMVSQFVLDKDALFSEYYKPWRKWMIDKELFKPTVDNRNVKIPKILKANGSTSFFWVFNIWPVFLWSKLAEIVDSFSEPEIDYYDLLNKFNAEFLFREEFLNIENLLDYSISHTKPSLYNRKEIIKQALKPYQIYGLIEFGDDYVYRKYSLLSSLKM